MLLVFEIYAIFLLFSFNGLFENENSILSQTKSLNLLFLVFLLILITGFRNGGIVTDYSSYEYMFNIDYNIIEPSFILIREIVKKILHSSIVGLMVVYAIIGISIKESVIKKYSSYVYLSFVVLIGDLFMQQDFTQIRCAVAVGIFMLSLNSLYEHNGKKYFLYCMFAFFFHTSALLMLPIYILNSKKINKWLCFFIILFSYLLAVLKFNPISLLTYLPIPYIAQKAIFYTNAKGDFSANVFSVYSLSKLFILLILLFKNKLLQQRNKYSVLLLKIQTISCCSLCIFSQNMVAALRISEFFSIADILLFPMFVSVVKEKTIAKILLISICFIWLTLRIFRYGLILI